MKLIFSSEDCIIGLIFGVLLVSMSEKWFKIPYTKTLLMILIPILAIVIFLDIASEITDLGRHFLFISISILHSIFDLVLGVAFYSVFFKFSLPYISMITPYLSNLNFLYYLGLFEIISHIVWLALTPFNN